MTAPAEAMLAQVLEQVGLAPDAAGGGVRIAGDDDPVLSLHRIGSANAAALAALGVGVGALWRERGGEAQDIEVDVRRSVQALRTIRYGLKNGRQLPVGAGPLSGYHRAGDGRWICIYAQHVLSHFLDAALEVLGCQHNPGSIERAVAAWKAEALEEALNERRVAAAMVRSEAEWASHPQGQWLAQRPVVEVLRIGDSPAEPLAPGSRPLSGLRVMDLTHALCGPYAARALAEQGADVLRLAAVGCRDPEAVVIDTGWGKRSAYVDLDDGADVGRTAALARTADVVVQSFRPGALGRRGLSPEALADLRPGIVYLSVSGYGDGGPWRTRGAFESLGQSVAGISDAEAFGGRPQSVRTGTLNDYLAAYLGAAGVVAALVRRGREGGSYLIRVSLARTSMWVRELGTVPGAEDHLGVPYEDPVRPSLLTGRSAFGEITALAPAIGYSATPGYWARPPEPLGSSVAAWLPR